ncbi:MAG: hypothetical protein JSS43_18675, partial [Proteobacteria bacterium]|nr:hypothetical protein [Pseudomonadota bacterium]
MIVPSGTVIGALDLQLIGNTVDVGSTVGPAAALVFSGDAGINVLQPSLDPATVVQTAVPGQAGAEAAVLWANGYFANAGTIRANGPAGSALTVNINSTSLGTAQPLEPGYFFNPGVMEADAGNTLVINVGSASALFNSNSIVANGGTVVINTDPAAIAGGVAGEAAFFVVRGGGTLETQAAIPFLPGTTSQPGGTTPRYLFGDATAGNTFKIDNLGSFSGGFVGFQAGDTVDLGGSLAISALSYDVRVGVLTLLNNSGTILGSLFLNTNGMATSVTAVPVAQSATMGIIVGTGADGDTILMTDRTNPSTSGLSGTWQSGTSWAGGIVPTGTDTPLIGYNQTAAFTLTTGAAPVSMVGFGVFDPNATLVVTSNLTALPGTGNIYAGTLAVASGATLLTTALREYAPSSWIDIAAGGTVVVPGRLNTTLAPINGTLAVTSGSTSAVQVYAGTMTVEGALIAGPSSYGNGGSFQIGRDGGGTPATVIVNNGTVTATYTLLGSDPTSTGHLILNGPSARWTDMIDPLDSVSSRGVMQVGFNDLSANSQSLPRPAPLGPAQLVIENFAKLTDQQGGLIASTVDSTGEVTVQTGGVWNLANNGVGYLSVGQSGTGSLSVLSGGTVLIGAFGTFLSNGTQLVTGGLGIGRIVGAQGTILVSGAGSNLTSYGGMSVGQAGKGMLSILNGGTVAIADRGIGVGQTASPASSGTIIVGGTGASALLQLGTASTGMTVGGASQGTLTVVDGGLVQNDGTGWLTVAGGVGSYGSLLVQGQLTPAVYRTTSSLAGGLAIGTNGTGVATVGHGGTILLTGTGNVTVGQFSTGNGLLTIESGGSVISNAGAIFGSNSGAHGTVVVTGAGSLFDNRSTVTGVLVGNGGNGVLQVTNGGTFLTSHGLFAGWNGSGNGVITVSGAGSKLINASTDTALLIGASGAGTLLAQNGATIATDANFDLGGQNTGPNGGAGFVSLTGGSRGNVAYSIYIWQGSTLSVDQTSGIDVGSSGSLTAGAVLIEAGHSLIGGGRVAASVVDNGVIQASGLRSGTPGTLEITGAITGNGLIDLAPAGIMKVDGALSANIGIVYESGGAQTFIMGGEAPGTITNTITGLD